MKCDAWLELQWRQTKLSGETLGASFSAATATIHEPAPQAESRSEGLTCRLPFFSLWLFFHFYFCVFFSFFFLFSFLNCFSFENVSRVHFSSFHCFPPGDVGSCHTGYTTNHAQQLRDCGGVSRNSHTRAPSYPPSPPRLIPQMIPLHRENRCLLDVSSPQRQSFFFCCWDSFFVVVFFCLVPVAQLLTQIE